MTSRFEKQLLAIEGEKGVILEGNGYQSFEVFTAYLKKQGKLDSREYTLIQTLYHILYKIMPPPNLLVHLRARRDTLETRIKQRARQTDVKFGNALLHALEYFDELIEASVKQWTLCPILIIDSEETNFLCDNEGTMQIASQIRTIIDKPF